MQNDQTFTKLDKNTVAAASKRVSGFVRPDIHVGNVQVYRLNAINNAD